MTFPVIQATNNSADTVSGTSHSINLPSGIQAGDLLIIVARLPGTALSPAISGFTSLYITDAGNIEGVAFYKVATGSEGSTVTITSNTSASCRAISYRISGYVGPPKVASNTTLNATSATPPALSPGLGTQDFLWLVVCSSSLAQTGFPSGYSSNISDAGVFAQGAKKTSTASSETPSGTFTSSTGCNYTCGTIGIRGSYTQAVTTSSTATVTVKKAVTKLLASISTTGTATVVASRAFLKTISITASNAVSVIRQAGKIISASTSSSVTLSRVVAKIVSITSSSAVTFRKAITKAVSAISTTGTVVVSSPKTILQAITAATTGIVTVSAHAGRVVVIAITALGSISIRRAVSKAIAIPATGAVTVLKAVGKLISASASAILSFAFAFFRFITQPSSFGKQITAARSNASQITSDSPSTRTITDGKSKHTDITSSNPLNRQITE